MAEVVCRELNRTTREAALFVRRFRVGGEAAEPRHLAGELIAAVLDFRKPFPELTPAEEDAGLALALAVLRRPRDHGGGA